MEGEGNGVEKRRADATGRGNRGGMEMEGGLKRRGWKQRERKGNGAGGRETQRERERGRETERESGRETEGEEGKRKGAEKGGGNGGGMEKEGD
uniref:Uncharacterized protein n=1 Tax=Octopus bimaculoides TaxID=37653 RepID=A0A0L8HDB7_OCTBM